MEDEALVIIDRQKSNEEDPLKITADDVKLEMESDSIDDVKVEHVWIKQEVDDVELMEEPVFIEEELEDVKVEPMEEQFCIEEEQVVFKEPIDNQEISQEILVYCPQQNTQNDYFVETITQQEETPKRVVQTMPQSVSFFCDICWKEFTDVKALEKHILYHEENRCEICNKKFDRKGGLSLHMNTHSKKPIFSCLSCDQKFTVFFNLTKHLNGHEEKKCGCEICGKKFAHPSALKIHMDTHPEYAPHKCTKCGKKFNQNAMKIRHMRTHHGEELYGCQICEAKFSTKFSLMKHSSTHGNTPFVCGVCGKSFSQNQSLMRHVISHE